MRSVRPQTRGRKPWGLDAAFTLTELLVVIAIIAVIVAIMAPVLARARAMGPRTVCLSNQRQLAVAILMYADDNDGWVVPYANNTVSNGCMDAATCRPDLLRGGLQPYVASTGVWWCPDDTVAGRNVVVWGIPHEYSSYLFLVGRLRVDGLHVWWTSGKTELVDPGTYMLIMDPNNYYLKSHAEGTNGYQCGEASGLPVPPAGGNHAKGINVTYLDAHAVYMPPDCQ